MAYVAPPVDELSRDFRSAIRAELPGTEPALWPNNLYILTKVFAEALAVWYQRLEWLHRQRFASTSDAEALDEHAADYGMSRLPPTIAHGNITVNATIGTVIPADTEFKRIDGVVFVTDSPVTTITNPQDIEISAAEAGKEGNTEAGVVLQQSSLPTIAGITSAAVADDGITGGTDQENDASFLNRILERKRNPPMGGSPGEYRTWARQYPGVTRVWVYRATPTPGSVTVVFMMDNAYSDGIPLAGDVAAVQAILDATAPSPAEIIVQAPVAQPINITISQVRPDQPTIRTEIEGELLAMIRRRAEPGTFEVPFIFSRSWLDEAISLSQGEVSHIMTIPAADVLCQATAPGNPPKISTLGTVTWLGT